MYSVCPMKRQEPAGQAGLLPDLAQRRLFEALALLELALGEGPVLVHRAVDQRDLQLAALASDHESAGGLDDLCR